MSRAERAQTALGVIRLVNGGIALLAPRRLTKTFGIEPEAEGAVVYVLRLFGVRTIFLGLGLLRSGDTKQEVRKALFIHASDTAAAVYAGLKGHLQPKAAATGAIASGVNTALAVLARESR